MSGSSRLIGAITLSGASPSAVARFLGEYQVQGVASLPGVALLDLGGATVTEYARTTGDDTTGDGTLANPYRTLERLLQDFPNAWKNGNFIADITGISEDCSGYTIGPYLCADPIAINAAGTGIGGPLVIQADLTVVTTFINAEITSQTSDAVTGLLTINTNRVLVVNAFRGMKVRDSNGFVVGVVASNTAGAIEVCAVGAVSRPFTIESDGATLIGLNLSQVYSNFYFVGIHLDAPAGFGNAITLTSCDGVNVTDGTLDGVSSSNVGNFTIGNCQVNPGAVADFEFQARNFGAVLCHFTGVIAAELTDIAGSISIIGCIFDSCGAVPCNGGEDTGGGSFRFSNCLVRNGVGAGVFVPQGFTAELDQTQITGCTASPCTVLGPGYLRLKRVKINGNTGDAVRAVSMARVKIEGVVDGSGNSGFALRAEDGAHIEMRSDTAVTGGAGQDIKSGSLAVQTYAAFRAGNKNAIDLTATTGELTRIWQAP